MNVFGKFREWVALIWIVYLCLNREKLYQVNLFENSIYLSTEVLKQGSTECFVTLFTLHLPYLRRIARMAIARCTSLEAKFEVVQRHYIQLIFCVM